MMFLGRKFMQRDICSYAKIAILITILVFSTACAHLESGIRDKAPEPVNFQDLEHPRPREQREEEYAVSGAEQEANATAVLEQVEKQNQKFNQRIASIMDQPGIGEAQPEPEKKDGPKTISGQKEVSFNFYDADLVEVVRVFMDLIGGDYVLHPDVSGRVSLSVEDKFTEEQLVDLLLGVLRINNMTMIQGKDGVWEVMPMSAVSSQLSKERIFIESGQGGQKRGQVIEVFRLGYIAATEMIKIIKPYLSQSATIYAHDAEGVLLICDYPHALDKVGQMVTMFDESVFADVSARVYTLKYAQVEEAVEDLQKVAKEFRLGPDQGGPSRRVGFVALQRTNTVVAVTRDPQVMQFVDAWVEELDKKVPSTLSGQQASDIFVYYVQYGDADTIVESLRGLFEGAQPEEQSGDKDEEQQKPVGRQVEAEEQKKEKQGSSQGVSGDLSGPVTFQVDEITNSILTRCNQRDYETILSVIEKLDLYPKQVLIEMVIAEVQLNDSSKLGIEWQYIMDVGKDGIGTITQSTGLGSFDAEESGYLGQGLSYLIQNTSRLKAGLHALAEDNQVQILSTPTLLASDNKQAVINIGDEVPIPTTSERRTDISTGELTTTTLQYRDTGIIMDVTPKINKHGMVRMEIKQEVSNLSSQKVEGVDAPIISTRNTETSVAVNDGQTIVIGGLIKQTRTQSNSGIPYLRNIPGLGILFRAKEDSFENTELIVFITPHVVLNSQDSDFITQDFKFRLQQLKQVMM
jgi:general secretion pathway protein D